MNRRVLSLCLILIAPRAVFCQSNPAPLPAGTVTTNAPAGFIDAASFGFSPEATGARNTRALQAAVQGGGTVLVSRPGTYRIAGTISLGGNTTLRFGNGVFLQKVWDEGPFSHVFVNKGAATGIWDEHVEIDGLQLLVNGVDVRTFREAYGLHGQVAFLHARDIRIRGFRCLDLGRTQFGIQVCTFEDLLVEDAMISGDKDGIHLGRGKRFTIRNCVFRTYDDALALNAHDYSTGNPELGWIEDGVVENCTDLPADKTTGYFCRILAGAWIDWSPGMAVQQSDTVVAEGRLYRVQAKPDGTVYKSLSRPTHDKGTVVLDGIPWGVVQSDGTHSAGVRNVVFRDIFLRKNRTAFSIHFDNDKYSRSYYPGAEIPEQRNLLFENIQVLHEEGPGHASLLLNIATPVDSVEVCNSRIAGNPIRFISNRAMQDYGRTSIAMIGCTFTHPGAMTLLENKVPGKVILLKTFASSVLPADFSASVLPGNGNVTIDSDLPGLVHASH